MSNTRHAGEDAPLRQERFMSSAEFERGLMANIVARRCEALAAPADQQFVDLIWFLQGLSHSDHGLEGVQADLLRDYPHRVGTRSMQRLGMKPGQVYRADEVRVVREELPHGAFELESFPLRGDRPEFSLAQERRADDPDESAGTRARIQEELAEARRRAQAYPTSYPAADFVERCTDSLQEDLAKRLARFCLDPELRPERVSPWYFPTLRETLLEYLAQWKRERAKADVVTSLGQKVHEALDYCLESACLVLVDGLARTGKTFAARAWCEQHPGQARYVQIPSTGDDIAFFRAIARSLGVSINLNSKAHQLRDRIEDTLQRSRLMVVFDEAHYLWPQGNYREALPARINWIMTALVNHSVPTALVVTPQFMRAQKRVEEKTCWTSEQFLGRIGHYERLPDHLEKSDLTAVARKLLPEGNAESITLLVTYACASAKYIAGIDTVARRARFLARRDGADLTDSVYVRRAIQEGVIPADKALATALAAHASKRQRGDRMVAPAMPVEMESASHGSGAAGRLQESRSDLVISD